MAGTKLGGQAAAQTNREKYGEDFYARIGSIGGKLGRTGGFAAGEEGRERARIYGRIGGMKSKRTKGDQMKRTAIDNRTAIQHGEAMLYPVDKMPQGEYSIVEKKIVAHSETGHHHVLVSEKPFETIGDIEKQDLYIRLFEPAKLVHQKTSDKHKTLTVPKGVWKVLHKSEYDPWAQIIRKVKD